MDNGSGWPFLMLFVAFGVAVFVALHQSGKERERRAQEFSRGANVAPTEKLQTPPELNIPDPDQPYDWRAEGDFAKRVVGPYHQVHCPYCPAISSFKDKDKAERIMRAHVQSDHA